MKKGIRLLGLLVFSFGITLFITSLCFYLLFSKQVEQHVHKQQQAELLKLGQQIAKDDLVKQALIQDKYNNSLQITTQKWTKEFHLDFIVIMNMQGIRLTHPNPQKIGQHFEGGDEKAALKGEKSTSISRGSLGKSLRGFIPIYVKDKQVGVVALGIRLTSLGSIIRRTIHEYSFSLILSLIIGCSCAVLLAYYIKRQLHHLEPREIARLLEERNAMLNETKDIVLVIDLQKKILLANFKAQALYSKLHGTNQSIINQPLTSILLSVDELAFQNKFEQFYQQNGQDYFISIAPIHVKNKLIGHIIIMKNATETLFLANQLDNMSSYALALQNQNHEFMNKLHVIYGLADLKAYDKLKQYLNDLLQPEKELTQHLALLIPQPILASFLLSQREQFKEKHIQFNLEIDSVIPTTLANQQLEQLLSIYQYIHQFILKKQLTKQLTVRIFYHEQILQTEYILTTNNTDKFNYLQTYLNQEFFIDWLKICQSHISFSKKMDDANQLTIQTKLMEENNETDINY